MWAFNSTYLQLGELKLGNTMNLMDNGATDIGDLIFSRTGDKLGISPVSVSCNGFPLRSIVLLWRLPPSGVRWYSSRYNVTSDDLLPTHETVSLRPCTNELFLWFFFLPTCKLVYALDWMLTPYWIWLLKLIRSKVTPACTKAKSVS